MSAPSDDLPVVGICAVRERARWSFWDQPAHLVAHSYVGDVQHAGGLPLLLPVDERAPRRFVELIDALILIGGADLDPASYGAEPEAGTETTYRDRDEFEIAMVHAALERGIPLLGICRGMQILNVALGGTLRQDIAAANGTNIHRRRMGTFEEAQNHVRLEAGSLAERAVGTGLHVAHCHHHQAVDTLGDGLVVSGRAIEDGLPEALELADGRWVLGVQWHPEAEDESALFGALVSTARGTPGAPSRSRGRRSAPARTGA